MKFLIRSYTATYHAGNPEQMNERINYAYHRLLDEWSRAKEDWKIHSFNTATAVDNETGRTTVTLICFREG